MRPVAKDDIMKYHFLSELKLSPDGKHLAMVESRCLEKENKYAADIWVYDCGTGKGRRMTFQGDARGISWLDNETLLFTAIRDEAAKKLQQEGERFTIIYQLPVWGGEASEYMRVPVASARLTKIGTDDFLVVGRYDGRKTCTNGMTGQERDDAVKAFQAEKDYELYDELPFWFNGSGVVNKMRNRLYRFRKAEGAWKLEAITEPLADVGTVIYRNEKAYYTTETYQDILRGRHAVNAYDPVTGEVTCLLPQGEYSVSALEMLGDQLVLVACDQKEYASTESDDLFLLDGKGGAVKWVELDNGIGDSMGTDCHYGASSCFCQDENGLYALISYHTGTRLIRIDQEGRIHVIYDGPYTLDGFVKTEDGFLATAMSASTLQELYSLKDGELTCLSSFHKEYLEETYVSIPEPVACQGPVCELEGFVIKPYGYEPGKKYPAILDIHGGPRAAYGDIFFHEMQYWAGLGYFVFFCNPRGSDARGDEFADIRSQYGCWDYEDIMAFTDYVLDTYTDIDRSRVGVTGGSYGGYMTNWIVGQTDRFAAAAAQRSISNWLTKILSTDIGYLYNMDQQGATPWEDPQKLWDHSPLKYAANVKTPLLLFQSEEDYRCWQAEAIQYFTALKLHGAEVKMCLVHGENHNLSRSGRPVQRLIRLTALTDWMDQHLK